MKTKELFFRENLARGKYEYDKLHIQSLNIKESLASYISGDDLMEEKYFKTKYTLLLNICELKMKLQATENKHLEEKINLLYLDSKYNGNSDVV